MIVAIVVLATSTVLLFGAIDAALDNVQTTRTDLDQKRALLAADAGLSAYEQQLSTNQDYWSTCPGPNGATGVTGITGQTGATVPGSTDDGSTETYKFANLPATGSTSCSTANPVTSTIQGTTGGVGVAGTFRVEISGSSGPTSGTAKISRTLVAQFQPNSFLNFVYFSNHEDEDPLWGYTYYGRQEVAADCGGLDGYEWNSPDYSTCIHSAFGTGDNVNGPLHTNDDLDICDTTAGAVTDFGRTSHSPPDVIQSYNPLSEGSCAGSYYVDGTKDGTDENASDNNNDYTQLDPPPDDTQLLDVADGGDTSVTDGCSSTAGCVFTGPTTIALDGASGGINYMTVTNSNVGSPLGQPTKFAFPSNDVVFVNDTQPVCNYTPFGSEDQLYGGTTLDTTSGDIDNAGCGDAVVTGASTSASGVCSSGAMVSGVCPYTQSLTVGAQNDIVIAGNLTTTTTTSGCASGEASCPTGTAVLGLVANENVRIFHPLLDARSTNPWEQSCVAGGADGDAYLNYNGTGSLVNPVIDAAILAVQGSFVVDNFDCGSQSNSSSSCSGSASMTALCNLSVYGAIAQNYRGRVAEYNPQVSGYVKNYWYDDRLAVLSPPYFLDPVNASWQVARVTECDTVSSCSS
jgi:Tfp pilus assembly protein PilX